MSEKELSELNHIVSMYLDYAELQARKHRLMKMQNWVEKLDAFLLFNDYEVLKDAGKVSAEVAKALAEGEYEKYRVIQDKLHESDFDELIKASKESEKITTTKTSL
ncbi:MULTISPECIES: RhuM family protein [unclassified Wolbachia]|uniref:RhuM family protein n=1 Tax=unclassified Wolbachia TaxID=2640676 RepID=UPI00313335F8